MRKHDYETNSGTKIWENSQGMYHNEEGPAWISANGTKAWFINNRFHRENGPTVIYTNGDKSWYINGKKVT